VSNWGKRKGSSCDAKAKQTLAAIRMRKRFLVDGMKKGRDARSKSEWIKEYKMIKENFGNPADVKKQIDDFSDSDANKIYCSPETDIENMHFNGDDRLVCDGKECVSCKITPREGRETFRCVRHMIINLIIIL